jgi:hypothetical protein
VKSNVPRSPEPDVAVTKSWCSTFPFSSSRSYSNVASNVFALPVTRSGLDTVDSAVGDSTRIAGTRLSTAFRVFPLTEFTVGNCVSV